jgi:hypothetical protein
LFFASAPATLAAQATVYPVYNHERPAGSMIVSRTANGDSIRVRFVFTDRNRGARIEVLYRMHGDSVVGIESRPVLANGSVGEPTEKLEITGDSVRRWSPAKSSAAKAVRGVFYTLTYSPFEELRTAKYLLRQSNHFTKTVGDSSLRLDVVKQLDVPTAHGRERVRLVTTDNGDGTPSMLWLDEHDELFATEADWFMTVKEGAEPALPTLRKAETELRDATAEAMNRRVVKQTSGTLAITNGDLFDSDRGVMRPRTTVIVRGERIVAVGPADSIAVPAGATVIDATGKTVMPGMWDVHGHMQATSQSQGGPMQLSLGVTTVRDLGSDPDIAVANRDRAAAGKIAGPREILSGFIDGPGAWAGPTPNIVRTEAEARAFVAHFDSLGYKQIKLYNLVHRPRADVRGRGAQARHAIERSHPARVERAGRDRPRLRRGQPCGVPVLDVLSGFSIHADDARLLARRHPGRAVHRRRRSGDDVADRRPRAPPHGDRWHVRRLGRRGEHGDRPGGRRRGVVQRAEERRELHAPAASPLRRRRHAHSGDGRLWQLELRQGARAL